MNTTEMREAQAEASPRFTARAAGAFYLLNTLTILLAVFFFRGLIVSRDPAATATNVLAHESRFWLGFAFELISTACSIAVTALLFELFRPVNRSVSLLAAFLRLIACAIAVFGYLFQLAALQVLAGAHYLSAVNLQELQALALLHYKFSAQASRISIVFFGFHFVLVGYLIFRSTFMPRILGAFLAFAGVMGLTFLAPPLGAFLFPYLVAIGLLAEISLTAWLVVVGVDVQRWKQQASAAGRW